MKRTVLFKDLGTNCSYKEIWDLQESMLQENVRRKSQLAEVGNREIGDRSQAIGDRSHEIGDRSQEIGDRSQEIGDRSEEIEAGSQSMVDNSEFSSGKSGMPVDSHLSSVNSQLSSVNSYPPSLKNHPSTQNHLLFVEHNPVYTLGKSGDINHVLIDEKERAEKGIEFFKINRGGDITFHGPGQLVGYPILDLDNFKTDLGWYLRSLEEVIILTMAEYGLKGDRSKGETGVWIDPDIKGAERKICAMGIRCSRWITMHGFAFNVNTDLGYFNHIIPCGIQNKQVTSLKKELGYEIPMQEAKEKVKRNFEKVFRAVVM